MAESNDLLLIRYEKQYEKEWDEFVEKESINGTFLQTRRFLNYHPVDRFVDASCIVRSVKEGIVAVCPACLKVEKGHKILYSHMGSTYGGIVIHEKWNKTHKMLGLLRFLEKEWEEDGIEQVVLKQTPSIFAKESQDLFEYCFYYLGYTTQKELNLFVDYDVYNEDIVSEFSHGKKGNVHACEKAGCIWRKVDSLEGVEKFHQLLSLTLEKYGLQPIHTVEEIYEFIMDRLKNECEIFGVFKDNEMIAGSMMFYFQRVKVAHTQYLCADSRYGKISPMTYTYYAMLCEMRRKGFRRLSWGIVTENAGKYLNDGLVDSKEAFGSKHGVNITYQKWLGL